MTLKDYIDACQRSQSNHYVFNGFYYSNFRSFRKEVDGSLTLVRDGMRYSEINSIEAENSVILAVEPQPIYPHESYISLSVNFYTTKYTLCRYISDDIIIKRGKIYSKDFDEHIVYEVKRTSIDDEIYALNTEEIISIPISSEKFNYCIYDSVFTLVCRTLKDLEIDPNAVCKEICTRRTSDKFYITVCI